MLSISSFLLCLHFLDFLVIRSVNSCCYLSLHKSSVPFIRKCDSSDKDLENFKKNGNKIRSLHVFIHSHINWQTYIAAHLFIVQQISLMTLCLLIRNQSIYTRIRLRLLEGTSRVSRGNTNPVLPHLCDLFRFLSILRYRDARFTLKSLAQIT